MDVFPLHGSSAKATSGPSQRNTSTDTSPSASAVFSTDTQSIDTQSTELPCNVTLWCQHRDILGCHVQFSAQDQDAWVEHHKEHLGYKYPAALACWLCGEMSFLADIYKGKGRLNEPTDPHPRHVANEKNFEIRMAHVARHIIFEAIEPYVHDVDILMLDFMREQNIIDPVKYQSVRENAPQGLGERHLNYGYRDDIVEVRPRPTDLSVMLPSIGNEREPNSLGTNHDVPPDSESILELCLDLIKLDLEHETEGRLQRRTRLGQGTFLSGTGSTRMFEVLERRQTAYWSRYLSEFKPLAIPPARITASGSPSLSGWRTKSISTSDEFMFSFNDLLDWTLQDRTGTVTCGNASDSNGGPKFDGKDRTGREDVSDGQGQGTNGEDRRDEGGDRGGGDRRGRRGNKDSPWDMPINIDVCQLAEMRWFACPFLKHDPHGRTEIAALTDGWGSIEFSESVPTLRFRHTSTDLWILVNIFANAMVPRDLTARPVIQTSVPRVARTW